MHNGVNFLFFVFGNLFEKQNRYEEAGKCYEKALSNVKSTEFFYEEALDPQAFIDEYITGVRMSILNYEELRKKQ